MKICKQCNGEGGWDDGEGGWQCDICNGLGFIEITK